MGMKVFSLSSSLLADSGVMALFSTRYGGDDLEGLARDSGFSTSRLYMATQVHGAVVIEISGQELVDEVREAEADALVTSTHGIALAVRTADCVPVLLAARGGGLPGSQVVAAVHAGWRGIVAGVISAAVRVMNERGVRASEICAAIGPAIDPCCFEVQGDVAETLARAVGRREIIVEGNDGAKPHVDLRAAVLWSLLTSGLRREQVEFVGPCTRCATELFHSYRREGGGLGRQFSVISIPETE